MFPDTTQAAQATETGCGARGPCATCGHLAEDHVQDLDGIGLCWAKPGGMQIICWCKAYHGDGE